MQSANQKFSKIPAVIGGAVLLGAAAFIGWGIWQAMGAGGGSSSGDD